MTTNPTILHAHAPAGEGKALPLGLSGLPAEMNGVPCYYRRRRIASVGRYVHRGTREPFELSAPRLDGLIDTFNRRIAKGIKPFFARRHTLNPSADDTLGYVVSLSREGPDLYADLQIVGADALIDAARNEVSLCTTADEIDADGVKYPECLHHVSATPNPALSNLGPFVTLAASAGGGPAVEAPVYAAEESIPMLTAERLKQLRAKFSLAETVPDADVAERAAAAALADPPAPEIRADPAQAQQITALSADKTRLEGELAAARTELTTAKGQVLALSAADVKDLDPMSLTLINRAFKSERQQVVAAGVLSEAGMNELDVLLGVGNGKAVALSLSAGSTDPLYIRVCDILRRHPGVKTNNGVDRVTEADPAQGAALKLDASGKPIVPDTAKEAGDAATKYVNSRYPVPATGK